MNRRMDAMKGLDEWLPRLRPVLMMQEPVQLLDDLQENLEAEEADADTLIDQCWDRVRPMLEEAASHTTGWSHNTIDGVYKGLRYWFHRIPDIPEGTGQIRPPIVVQSPSFERGATHIACGTRKRYRPIRDYGEKHMRRVSLGPQTLSCSQACAFMARAGERIEEGAADGLAKC